MSAKKKVLALLLALLMASSAVGCASDNTADGTADTTASADNTALEENEPVETEPEYVMWENLPETTLEGFEFRIVEYTPTQDTGATVLHGDATELTGEA